MDGSVSETSEALADGAPRLQRVVAEAALSVRHDPKSGATRLERLRQSGSVKLRMPRVHGPEPEAVLINTAGGLTGGDRLSLDVALGAGAAMSLSTQAAERIYRSRPAEPPARFDVQLRLEPGSRLAWLPQETILFEGGRLARRIEADLAEDAELLVLEPLVIGRQAMGETVAQGSLTDQWRIRRCGVLVHAEALKLGDPVTETLARSAVANGARAMACGVWVGPEVENRLDAVRETLRHVETLAPGIEAAASATANRLIIRMLAPGGSSLRKAILGFLTDARRGNLPRVWSL